MPVQHCLRAAIRRNSPFIASFPPRIAQVPYQSTTFPASRLSNISAHFSHTATSPSRSSLDSYNMASLPKTQSAIVIYEQGKPEVMKHEAAWPISTPVTGTVLVKNTLIGVNYIDTYHRDKTYRVNLPLVLGREAVGTVAALPDDASGEFKVGDRVLFMGGDSYAEYTLAAANKTVKVPEGVTDEDAIGSYLMGLTALTLAAESFEVKPGHTALLHAGAGGVGLLLTQILKAKGATVISTAGGEEKVKLVESLGADLVIDYKGADADQWVSKVKNFTNGNGVDVVYDGVGLSTWEQSLQVVKRKGTVVFFGNASGKVPPFDINIYLAEKNIKVLRPRLDGYVATREEFSHYVNELFHWLQGGKLKVKLHKIYPLTDAVQAHKDLQSRGTTGKLLLKP